MDITQWLGSCNGVACTHLEAISMQVGKDAYAGMLRSALADSGVNTSLLNSVEGSCGTAVILLQPSGG